MNPGDVISGKYILERELGRGRNGEVWLARHRLMGKSVAIKSPPGYFLRSEDPVETAQEIIRNAKIGIQVNHPGVINIHDIDISPETYYVVMDYIERLDLEMLIADRLFTVKQITTAAGRVLDILAATHYRGSIHGDLKPSNILISTTWEIYLTDFWTANMLELVTWEMGIALAIPGDGYTAPEQIERERFGPVTPATDIYSLGATMYYMATGRPPFVGTSIEVLKQTCETVPAPVTDANPRITPGLNAVIMKALAKDPKDRFASAEEMAKALRSLD